MKKYMTPTKIILFLSMGLVISFSTSCNSQSEWKYQVFFSDSGIIIRSNFSCEEKAKKLFELADKIRNFNAINENDKWDCLEEYCRFFGMMYIGNYPEAFKIGHEFIFNCSNEGIITSHLVEAMVLISVIEGKEITCKKTKWVEVDCTWASSKIVENPESILCTTDFLPPDFQITKEKLIQSYNNLQTCTEN